MSELSMVENYAVKQEIDANIFTIDNHTQIEFLTSQKTIIVIDKDRFLVCKQLLMENASDEDFADFLNIPLDKVRYFKHKMQLFEDSIRVRRRAARLNTQRKRATTSTPKVKKREMSATERFKRARELIAKNYSTNQVSQILKISERSVTRFKKRIREERMKLISEGKIKDNIDDGESTFKFLPARDKTARISELFDMQISIQDISKVLKISERSVRRWKDRLAKMGGCPAQTETMILDSSQIIEMKEEELKRTDSDELDNDLICDPSTPKHRKRARLDREKVQYATELIENGLSNKEISMLLEMSVACVRKLKTKILDGTADELIDDSLEHFKQINTSKSNGIDPLQDYSEILMPSIVAKQKYERKPKVNLSDRDMYIVRLLRDNDIRTMDIARILGISERSVTRLITKSKELTDIEYDQDIVDEVEKLLGFKTDGPFEIEAPASPQGEESNENVAQSLLAMNVKVKDIARMLHVDEQIVHKWKNKMVKQEVKTERPEHLEKPTIKKRVKQEEYIVEYLE